VHAVSYYPASMVSLIWFADKKNIHRVSTKQQGGLKSAVSQTRNSTISQALCAGALFCSHMQKANYNQFTYK